MHPNPDSDSSLYEKKMAEKNVDLVMIELGRDLTYEVNTLTLDARVNYFNFSKTDNPGLITDTL